MRAGVLLIEEGTNATATNACERATNVSERATNAMATAPAKKRQYPPKKTAATKKSASEGDAEVLAATTLIWLHHPTPMMIGLVTLTLSLLLIVKLLMRKMSIFPCFHMMLMIYVLM